MRAFLLAVLIAFIGAGESQYSFTVSNPNSYDSFYGPVGEMTNNCKEFISSGSPSILSSEPYMDQMFGPYVFYTIKYLETKPEGNFPHGLVKLRFGGLNTRFAILSFTVDEPLTSYNFLTTLCW
uniref:Reelin domain-containing protein n=1 Tax=Graphocephala atropunctata TaxID=36148 RepID=A0A1B6L9X7_9HEMI